MNTDDFLVAARAWPQALQQWAKEIAAAALAYHVPHELLAAICEQESLYGEALTPKGPRGVGDKGHGRGLLQVDDRWHPSFVNALFDEQRGEPLWGDPYFAFGYAGKLMRRNLILFDGWLPGALAAYNAGPKAAKKALARLPPDASDDRRMAAVDACTANQEYVTRVLARQQRLALLLTRSS